MSINGCILYPEQCSFLYKASFLSLFTSLYAIYNKHYDIALVPFSIFCTSINYWRKPDYSYRRYIDIICVKAGLSYQIIRSYNAQYSNLYYMTLFIAIYFYVLGVHYYNKKLYWYSTYSHSMLHIIANISNIILYSGHIPPLY